MATDAKILFPDREVKIGDETIKVRELKWAETLAFLKELGGYIGNVMDAKGEVQVSPSTIANLVASSEGLTVSLLTKATQMDANRIAELPMSAVLELVDVALELNLSDDLIAKGKSIAGRFQKFAGARPRIATPASERLTTS